MTRRNLDRLRAHQTNIHRYRRLLATRLSELERAYIERRLNDEKASVKALLRQRFPDRLPARMHATSAEIAALLNPADAFGHPMDVVEDCDLTSYEKRAILSSWAADVCAMDTDLGTGSPSQGVTASFDDIVDALHALEEGEAAKSDPDNDRCRPSGSYLGRPSL
jgi:hypothetical protein